MNLRKMKMMMSERISFRFWVVRFHGECSWWLAQRNVVESFKLTVMPRLRENK